MPKLVAELGKRSEGTSIENLLWGVLGFHGELFERNNEVFYLIVFIYTEMRCART